MSNDSTSPRVVNAKLNGFTPLMDSIIKQLDLEAAAVWGRVWRYEQGDYGVCQASHETLAADLGLHARTVIRRLQLLVEHGFLHDHTPDLKNRPHTYSTTRKAHLSIDILGMTESHTEEKTGMTESHTKPEKGVTKSQRALTPSHGHYDSESHEDTKKIIRETETEENSSLPVSALQTWEKLLTALKYEIPGPNYKTYLEPLRLVDYRNGGAKATFVLAAPDEEKRTWAAERLGPFVRRQLAGIHNNEIALEFILQEPGNG
ncbi:MAG TPA: helix-turn-helix domain-containing protein [Anaerolineales bacterium]|nr:helix-turn-helix domain-containing protein [Anaerolineales bacterium]